MKWIVVWVAIFLGSLVVFVGIPRPALLWIASSLDASGDDMGHVKNRTGSPAEPVSEGGDAVASRQTSARSQADPPAWAWMIEQALALGVQQIEQGLALVGEREALPAGNDGESRTGAHEWESRSARDELERKPGAEERESRASGTLCGPATIELTLMRALEKAVDYSDRANAQLDQPERYRRESQERWRRCRSR